MNIDSNMLLGVFFDIFFGKKVHVCE